MAVFTFENLVNAPEAELILFSDSYYEAKIIDSPRDYFANLKMEEQQEILSFYRNGKFLKILRDGKLIGLIGHGVKPNTDVIIISYIFLPAFRGKGLFSPMIEAFSEWCLGKYPEKKYFRANTEKTNTASIQSLQKAGFEFLEEKMEGPSEGQKVLFRCFRKKIELTT